MWLWTLALAWGAPEVEGVDAPSGPLGGRVVADDADLILLYGGEQRGDIAPCSCDVVPKGGLARTVSYADAVRAASPDTRVLLLNAGAWLSTDHDGPGLNDVALADNAKMHHAMRIAPWDVLNVSVRDWPGVATGPRPGLVSANLRHPDVPVVRYRLFEADDHVVAVTGVSRPGLPHLQPEDLDQTAAPVDALRDLLPELRSRADVVVVLAYQVPQDIPALAALPGVDVVIEADRYRERWGPWVESDAVWVRTWHQTTRLGELRLWLDPEGTVTRALERVVDLDAGIPEHAALARLAGKP